jgi:hypothetical protein
MARPKKIITPDTEEQEPTQTGRVSLGSLLSKPARFLKFQSWLIGTTPLICHAWTEKSRREMLETQVGAVQGGKEPRDPEMDFRNSLYEMGDGTYGFPAMGVKNSVISAAHKDKGIPKTEVMAALSLDAEMVRTRPALQGAICDMPLVRIYGSEPLMREDMVKIGKGLSKTASLAYRGQFTHWALRITGQINTMVMKGHQLAFLFREAGIAYGLGEWRNEKHGVFGAFRLATPQEEAEWESFAAGDGPMPVSEEMRMAAE